MELIVCIVGMIVCYGFMVFAVIIDRGYLLSLIGISLIIAIVLIKAGWQSRRDRRLMREAVEAVLVGRFILKEAIKCISEKNSKNDGK